MKLKFKHLDKIVGSFVLLSVITIFIAVIAIGRSQHWFEKNFPYRTVFSENTGLKPGSAVQMMGIDVGEITAVTLNPENKIEVHFKIKEKYIDKIRSDSIARATSSSLLGGKVLEITVGSALLSAVEPESIVPSEEGGGIAALLKSGRIESILSKVDAIVYHLREITEKLVDSSEYLESTLGNLTVLTDRIRRGEGSIGHLLSDKDDIYQELLTSIQHTREALQNLKATSEEIRQISPEARRLVERGEESLIEAQRVIKAIQKTWPLSRNIPTSPGQPRIQIDSREDFYPQNITNP